MEQLPIFLSLKQSACLVVGGGVVAERKINLLLRAQAQVTVLAPSLTKSLQRLSENRKITHIARNFETDQFGKLDLGVLKEKRLVVVAVGAKSNSKTIAARVVELGLLCNVVDDPEASNFVFPAIVDRSPVVIAIGTGGNAPVLAQNLKSQIELWLPARISVLARQAGRWRALVKRRFSSLQERRRFWQSFFSGAIAEHLLANRFEKAEHLFRKKLIREALPEVKQPGEAYIVGAGPGDPGLLTMRAHQLIRQAEVILYDCLVSKEVLDYARKDALLICVGKRLGQEVMSQKEINALLVEKVKQGLRVCRLKGGDPFIFGRGGEEVKALVDAKLSYQIVPGISAALGCAAYAGVPLTYRGLSTAVVFATSTRKDQNDLDWEHLSRPNQTLVLYMGVANISRTTKQLIAHGLSVETPVAMIENGTSQQQRVLHTTLEKLFSDAKDRAMHAPAILIIGQTAAMGRQFSWFGDVSDAQAPFPAEPPWSDLSAMSA